MSVTGFDGKGFDDHERVNAMYQQVVDQWEKFRYKVVSIGGDLYYEKMSKEETLSKAFHHWKQPVLKNQHEVDVFVADNINKKLSLDGP